MRLRTIVVCAVVLTACGAASADAQPSVTQPDPWPTTQSTPASAAVGRSRTSPAALASRPCNLAIAKARGLAAKA